MQHVHPHGDEHGKRHQPARLGHDVHGPRQCVGRPFGSADEARQQRVMCREARRQLRVRVVEVGEDPLQTARRHVSLRQVHPVRPHRDLQLDGPRSGELPFDGQEPIRRTQHERGRDRAVHAPVHVVDELVRRAPERGRGAGPDVLVDPRHG